MGGFVVNVWIITAMLIRVALVIAIVILIIKGIKYFNRREEQDVRQNCQRAQDTIDEIERELNDRKKD